MYFDEYDVVDNTTSKILKEHLILLSFSDGNVTRSNTGFAVSREESSNGNKKT